MGGKNENKGVVSPESVPIHLTGCSIACYDTDFPSEETSVSQQVSLKLKDFC